MLLNFSPLFQPYTLNNGIVIKNRLVVAPMTHYGSHTDGSISDEERAFLRGRAADFGLFITAATLVSPEGKTFHGQPYAFDEAHLPSLRETAQIIQAQGAKAVLQIHHGGLKAMTADKVAPSAQDDARELTAQEVDALVARYAYAAKLAIAAGFDGMEIHGANGYLIQQFVSRQSNRRADRWGEPTAFPLAVIAAVQAEKQAAQRDDFIVGYRFSPEEAGDNGLTMADTFALIDALVQQPLQYLHVSLWDFYKHARRGHQQNAHGTDTPAHRRQAAADRRGLPAFGRTGAGGVCNGLGGVCCRGQGGDDEPEFCHAAATGQCGAD